MITIFEVDSEVGLEEFSLKASMIELRNFKFNKERVHLYKLVKQAFSELNLLFGYNQIV